MRSGSTHSGPSPRGRTGASRLNAARCRRVRGPLTFSFAPVREALRRAREAPIPLFDSSLIFGYKLKTPWEEFALSAAAEIRLPKAERTRRQILAAAERPLRRIGVREAPGSTTSPTTSGWWAPTILYHFPDKRALYEAVRD